MYDALDQKVKDVVSGLQKHIDSFESGGPERRREIGAEILQFLSEKIPTLSSRDIETVRVFALKMIREAMIHSDFDALRPCFWQGPREVANMILVPRLRMVDMRVAQLLLKGYGFRLAPQGFEFEIPGKGPRKPARRYEKPHV